MLFKIILVEEYLVSLLDRVPRQLLYQISWVLSVVTILFVFVQIYAPSSLGHSVFSYLPQVLLVIAEIICYGLWQLYIPVTEFNRHLGRLSLFMMIFAVVQAISQSQFLHLVVVIIAVVSWSQLYSTTGGFSLLTAMRGPSTSPQQKLVVFVFLRLLVSPVIGAIYLFIHQVNPDVDNQIELITAFSAFFVANIVRYCLVYDQTQ